MHEKLKAIIGLIEVVLAITEKRCARMLWLDMATGDVDLMDGCESVDEAVEVCAREFSLFATTCEEDCGQPPTNLYDEAHIILDADLHAAAVITYRKPAAGESAYPVMLVARNHEAIRDITAESVVDSACDDAA